MYLGPSIRRPLARWEGYKKNLTAGARSWKFKKLLFKIKSHQPEVMKHQAVPYEQVLVLASALEQELKRLRRWDEMPLSEEKFEDMGAFGSQTMTFEQWLQFVLIPRIQTIVEEKGEFPDESMLAAYAIRNFDGDPDANGIHDLLYNLDDLINAIDDETHEPLDTPKQNSDVVVSGSDTIPPVLFTLAELLPQCKAEDLENQLQTIDTFLSVLSPHVRTTLSEMIRQAAKKTEDPSCRLRLEKAAFDIERGSRATPPYDHAEAMKKYTEDHKKSFPV